MEILTIAKNPCKCRLCGRHIKKGEQYLYKYFNVWQSEFRLNICVVCLKRAYLEINKRKLKKVEVGVVLDKLK